MVSESSQAVPAVDLVVMPEERRLGLGIGLALQVGIS